jgi:hypothetical protein
MKKRALLVGVNVYPDPSYELKGCVNDVLLMEKTLREQYGFVGDEDVRVLTDARATTRAILNGLSWLTAGAAPGDALLFHYSGHGSQVPDADGDETSDGLDEILCPYDLDWERPLTDDDLAAACSPVPKGALLTVILDCCHSGTGLREPAHRTARAVARFLPNPAASVRPGRGGPRRFGVALTRTNAILIAACRDDQTSADAYIEGAYHGAHTFYLCRTLRDAGWKPTYRELAASTGLALAYAGFEQVPQLEGPARLLSSSFLDPAPVVLRPARGHAESASLSPMRRRAPA